MCSDRKRKERRQGRTGNPPAGEMAGNPYTPEAALHAGDSRGGIIRRDLGAESAIDGKGESLGAQEARKTG